MAPDIICELTVFPYCYSLTNTCDYYLPLLIDLSLTFQIGKKRYTIPPEGYTQSNQNAHKCEILVSWVVGEIRLGMPFLKSFVTSFNYEENTVTFGVNKNAPAGTLTSTEIQIVKSRDAPWVAISFFILFIILIVFYCIWKNKTKTQTDQRESLFEFESDEPRERSTLINNSPNTSEKRK